MWMQHCLETDFLKRGQGVKEGEFLKKDGDKYPLQTVPLFSLISNLKSKSEGSRKSMSQILLYWLRLSYIYIKVGITKILPERHERMILSKIYQNQIRFLLVA